jgi:hypothetical protein
MTVDFFHFSPGFPQLSIDIISPIAYESCLFKRFHAFAPVAQLDRVPDYESVGRRFESCRARHLYQGVTAFLLYPFFLEKTCHEMDEHFVVFPHGGVQKVKQLLPKKQAVGKI